MQKLFVIVFLLFTFSAFGQTDNSSLKLNGIITNPLSSDLVIYKFDKSFEVSIPIDHQGKFSSQFKIKEPGVYIIKNEKAYTSIFLKNGYEMTLNADANFFNSTLKLEGNGALFNNYLTASNKLDGMLVGNTKDFFVVPIEDFLKKIASDSSQLYNHLRNTKLEKEDAQLASKLILYDYLLKRNNYRKFYVFNTKTEPFIPDNYLDPIRDVNMNDEDAYNNSMDYRYLIIEKWRLLEAEARKKDSTISVIDFTRDFANKIYFEPIRDQIVRMLFNKVDSRNPSFETDYLKIKPLIRVEKTIAEIDTRLATARSNKSGNKLADFNYENHKGGLISLSSLKGKYVYIDIWATWCGPCIKEFPELDALINDYKGNDKIE